MTDETKVPELVTAPATTGTRPRAALTVAAITALAKSYREEVRVTKLAIDDTSPIRVDVDAPQQHYDAAGSWRRIEFTYADGCKIILDGEFDAFEWGWYVEPDPTSMLSYMTCDQLGLPPIFPEVIYSANITPHATGIAGWSVEDVVNALNAGNLILPSGTTKIGGTDDVRLSVTTSSGAGAYAFTKLPPGNYCVRIPTPPAAGRRWHSPASTLPACRAW